MTLDLAVLGFLALWALVGAASDTRSSTLGRRFDVDAMVYCTSDFVRLSPGFDVNGLPTA